MKVKQAEIGVATVGLGVGVQHVRAFLATGHCELRWVYDLDPEKSRRLVEELGQGTPAVSFEQILKDPGVEVISIASYDHLHYEQTLRALRAGKHLFVEKPLCRSLEELKEIKRGWEENGGRHLASNLVLRAAPLTRWLQQGIASGKLGRLYAFDGDYLYGRLQKITEGWRKDVENYSVMQGGWIHLVDLMLTLLGERPVSVTALGNRISTKGTAFRYNDYVAATFQFPSGLIGRITANFGSVHRHQHGVRLFGTEGTFIYDDEGPRFHTSRDPSVPAEKLEWTALPSSKGDLIPGFVEAILTGKEIRSQVQREFDVVSNCVAVDKALATSASVSVEYL